MGECWFLGFMWWFLVGGLAGFVVVFVDYISLLLGYLIVLIVMLLMTWFLVTGLVVLI